MNNIWFVAVNFFPFICMALVSSIKYSVSNIATIRIMIQFFSISSHQSLSFELLSPLTTLDNFGLKLMGKLKQYNKLNGNFYFSVVVEVMAFNDVIAINAILKSR